MTTNFWSALEPRRKNEKWDDDTRAWLEDQLTTIMNESNQRERVVELQSDDANGVFTIPGGVMSAVSGSMLVVEAWGDSLTIAATVGDVDVAAGSTSGEKRTVIRLIPNESSTLVLLDIAGTTSIDTVVIDWAVDNVFDLGAAPAAMFATYTEVAR